ncbi:MAG TPA: TetR/AcrR family transcriptional regulator [Opitutaceae bacterium]|jgi:AcrR family transcriptional regulator
MPRPTKSEAARSPKRDQLVAAAARLFYRDGYHAVGIDTILADAQIAKMTLYRNFATKEDLIVATIQKRAETISGEVSVAVSQAGPSMRSRLLALFGWYENWFRSPGFAGCAMLRAAGEYPELGSAVHQSVVRAKAAGRANLELILSELDPRRAKELASQIDLLLQGAISCAHTYGDPSQIDHARKAALNLLERAHSPHSPGRGR